MHSRARSVTWVGLCALALVGTSRSLAAQRVTGHVTESSSNTPVAGAVVALLDSTGKTMARTVTNASGLYQLAGAGGAAKITAIHIGFRPASAAIATLTADASLTANLSLDVLPQLLDAVAVHDQTLCPATKSAPAAFALWDQARNALLASVVARDVDAPKVRSILYTRKSSANGRRIDTQTVVDSIYVASKPVVAVRTAQAFAAKGYRIRSATTDVFLGPDAEVLMDSTFLRGHCLSVVGDANAPTPEVGIAFEPTPHQDSVVDIAGVLWLSRTLPAIDSLTFHFTNVSRAETAGGAGGQLLFTTMPNGVAMITHWTLHIPKTPDVVIDLDGIGTQQRGAVDAAGFRDTGGDIAEASWSNGTAWVGQLPMITGHVFVAGNGAAVPDAIVRIAGTTMATQVDSTGAFTLPMTVPGPYVVEAEDELMAQFGIPWRQSTNVDLVPSGTDVRIELPARVGNVDLSHGPALLHVFDQATRAPIDRAAIRDTLGNQMQTSSTGTAVLNALRPIAGYYMLEVRKPGYAPQRFKLRADTAAEFVVAITPSRLGSTATLPTVEVNATRLMWSDAGVKEGFFARCERAVPSCVGRKMLDSHPALGLGTLILQAPGMHCHFVARSTGVPDGCIPEMYPQFGARSCEPVYFLDGYRVPLYNINSMFDPKHTYGIEIYRSGIARPERFDTPGYDCGAILIWTQ
ncbi:MAG TPA: carboxypeptidase-like regulatory domain-containing protein [Gemmatimonadaceae bacterium]|jgi:hypothetical protein